MLHSYNLFVIYINVDNYNELNHLDLCLTKIHSRHVLLLTQLQAVCVCVCMCLCVFELFCFVLFCLCLCLFMFVCLCLFIFVYVCVFVLFYQSSRSIKTSNWNCMRMCFEMSDHFLIDNIINCNGSDGFF